MPDTNPVTRKLGPLPAYGWALLAIGGYLGWQYLKGTSAAASPNNNAAPAAVTPNMASSGNPAGDAGGGNGAGNLSADLLNALGQGTFGIHDAYNTYTYSPTSTYDYSTSTTTTTDYGSGSPNPSQPPPPGPSAPVAPIPNPQGVPSNPFPYNPGGSLPSGPIWQPSSGGLPGQNYGNPNTGAGQALNASLAQQLSAMNTRQSLRYGGVAGVPLG